MKKIHRQLNESVIHPPRAGPMAGATTTATPYRAKAAPRLAGGNVSVRMACSLGASPAAADALEHAGQQQRQPAGGDPAAEAA